MRIFAATHARLTFWLAMVPGFALLIAGLARFGSQAAVPLYLFFVLWALAAFVTINRQALALCRPAMELLDQECDPGPLLELSRKVLRQNPDSLFFRVQESWALSLMGREEEALAGAEQVRNHPRLWKTPALLLTWCSCLPPDHPAWGQVEAVLAGQKLPPALREGADRTLSLHRALLELDKAPAELEELFLAQLDRASCPRELVGAHLALGAFYCARKDLRGESHLEYVLASAGGLKGAVHQGERLLCLLPAPRG